MKTFKREKLVDGSTVYRLYEGAYEIAAIFKSAGYWVICGPRLRNSHCELLVNAKQYAIENA
jgi:hypothetical protein